ncbi:sporulation protein [Bacillus sp. MRMR6]|uniref:sporulation protein n=1 Tax=Bacillus sp. MRMR6 TaxID=1928617 RepID=UPI000951E022|nr:sporulation protein [Bacillus sp. MRMR6]OLS41835.1 sporulation protein [Bacillus sp. MRMR6]
MDYINRFLLLVCVFLLASCNQGQPIKDSQLALIRTTNPDPEVTQMNNGHDQVKKIEKDVSDIEELYDVAVLQGKKEALVVYKVRHMQRFRMKQIEKELNAMLEEKYPKENFTVSSDYKIFLEAVRLDEKIDAREISDKQAEKRLNEIIKKTKDMK